MWPEDYGGRGLIMIDINRSGDGRRLEVGIYCLATINMDGKGIFQGPFITWRGLQNGSGSSQVLPLHKRGEFLFRPAERGARNVLR